MVMVMVVAFPHLGFGDVKSTGVYLAAASLRGAQGTGSSPPSRGCMRPDGPSFPCSSIPAAGRRLRLGASGVVVRLGGHAQLDGCVLLAGTLIHQPKRVWTAGVKLSGQGSSAKLVRGMELPPTVQWVSVEHWTSPTKPDLFCGICSV